MENNANIVLFNGLGDKLLDMVGFYIICKYLNYKPHVRFINDTHFAWGSNTYDIELFDYTDIVIITSDDTCSFFINSPDPSCTLSPYRVYVFIKRFIPEITFEQISNDFSTYAKHVIRPSDVIIKNIPIDIEKAYGIHLRKTDKIRNQGDIRHENLSSEFDIITNKLLEDVKIIILNETDPQFLIVSEDTAWKLEITNIIKTIAIDNNKQVKIIEIDYTNEGNFNNFNSVLDMFLLSKCKEILQGVKYSTFSILASLLGNGKLRNYANHIDSNSICFIHAWNSVVEINNRKNYDEELHNYITRDIARINTDICQIFSK